MKLNLKKAYTLLKKLEQMSTTKCLNIESLEDDIENTEDILLDDIDSFNCELQFLDESISMKDLKKINENIVKLAVISSGLTSILDNFTENIDKMIKSSNLISEKYLDDN